MSPKEKVTATSSESTSSSNSSSSSSSSSSTSGSESSSSDSENSSSSQASAAKSQGSTDSDNRKPAPKKKASPVKGKNAASNEAETSKTKEKTQTKGRNSKAAANYSSEEDVPIKPPPKRKPPAKPKATATVTPITKPRQPTARAKAAAARANANKEKNTKGAASKQTESAAQKKLKTKSIFSPENSSESDDQSAQPPKLSPMKSTAKVMAHSKPKPKATSKVEPVPAARASKSSKSNSSATSTSASSASSDSSSDSESSADSAATAKPAKKKACTIKKISACAATSATSGRQRGEAQSRSKTQTTAGEAATTAAASESEGEPAKPIVTRKLTRSSSARRSKHLIGKTSDTESETEAKAKSAPAKKAAGPKGPAQRSKTKTRSAGARDSLQKPMEEERKCPLEGCDSLGHLNGKLDRHFTIDACPMYHNKSAQECKDVVPERKKHEDDRRKAMASVNKRSPKAHLTADQRHFQMKIKEMRTKFKAQASDQQDDASAVDGKEREPKLMNLVPDYDLRLFQEAQAVASEKIEEDLKTLPHVKGTKYVEMGKFEMEVWYQSPYPEEYCRVPKLYICEYCLRYMKSRTILKRHMVKCVWRHPPGEEVYRKEKISVWEVDGKRYKQYCQNLCLLAKFFLDHKTLYYDVEPFLFYVMTIGDAEGCHTVGYFSKEKNSFLNYNVSCILTLPPYQRQGYGRLLIDFSYLLTRVERKIGSPEKPLSDLGLISYRSYWKDVLLEYLCKFGGKELSIKDLSQEMAINSYDIVSTLQALGMMKYWKGKHIILKKQDVIEEYEERMKRRGSNYKEIDPAYLKWAPFAAPPTAGPP